MIGTDPHRKTKTLSLLNILGDKSCFHSANFRFNVSTMVLFLLINRLGQTVLREKIQVEKCIDTWMVFN